LRGDACGSPDVDDPQNTTLDQVVDLILTAPKRLSGTALGLQRARGIKLPVSKRSQFQISSD